MIHQKSQVNHNYGGLISYTRTFILNWFSIGWPSQHRESILLRALKIFWASDQKTLASLNYLEDHFLLIWELMAEIKILMDTCKFESLNAPLHCYTDMGLRSRLNHKPRSHLKNLFHHYKITLSILIWFYDHTLQRETEISWNSFPVYMLRWPFMPIRWELGVTLLCSKKIVTLEPLENSLPSICETTKAWRNYQCMSGRMRINHRAHTLV